MKLDCYRVRQDAPPIQPASPQRDWMDQSAGRFAYRCLPLGMANSSGWELRLPTDVKVSWSGKPDRKAVVISGHDPRWPVRAFVQSHFGEGVVTFVTGYLFRTSPGVAIWASGPPNTVKDGIAPLTGLIETDWLPFPFTMNWRFTRPGEVTFQRGEAYCFFTLIDHGGLGQVNPRVADIGVDPELEREYRAWSESRSSFIQGLEANDPATLKAAWQRHYMRGRTLEGDVVEDHVSARRMNAPEPGRD